MSDEFDPYAVWLGIEPDERPINHYQLLGIDLFEADPATIEAAAEQQMVHVRTFQTGPRGRYTQPILNELAAARLCLLNADKKAAYDQMLEGLQLVDAAPTTPEAPPVVPPPVPAPPPVSDLSETVAPAAPVHVQSDRLSQRGADSPWIVALLIVGLIAGVVGVFMVARHLVFPPQPPSQQPIVRPGALPDTVEQEPADPWLVRQQANGSVLFLPSQAQLEGNNLQVVATESQEAIVNWLLVSDVATWRFNLQRTARNAVFKVRITYSAPEANDGSRYIFAIGDEEQRCELRGRGEVVTDEHYIAILNTGEHTLEVRPLDTPDGGLMTLYSVELIRP